jgi:tRNA 2-thiouridine synthesizing protein C
MNASQKQTFTFISRTAPYGSNRPQLCLDTALAAAIFEQQVNYLFMEDGVYQLLKNQDAEAIHTKTIGRILETLNLYGIESIYVCKESLESRGLLLGDLVIESKLTNVNELKTLLNSSDTVINL